MMSNSSSPLPDRTLSGLISPNDSEDSFSSQPIERSHSAPILEPRIPSENDPHDVVTVSKRRRLKSYLSEYEEFCNDQEWRSRKLQTSNNRNSR